MAGESPGYGLEAVILHHSFEKVRGRTIRMEVHFRTHIGGGNGEGKSSILSLIPAFYGEEPERIVTKASGKSSFVDYYLPSFQSLIIFEYRREFGLYCAVMYRHTQGKPVYRFVAGSAEETFFSDECRALMEAGSTADEIFAHLRKQQVVVSKTIDTITNYRAIIQRNSKLLKRLPGEAKSLRSLASQFGLGDSNSQMTNIDRLTHVVLNRHRLLSSFKSMICETQFESIHVHARPRAIDRKDLVADIQSLTAFAREEEKIRACLRKDAERLAMEEQSDKTVANLQVTVEEDAEKLREHRERRDTLEDQRRALKDDHENADAERAQELSDAKADHERLENELSQLYRKNDEYDNAGLPELAMDYDNLPEFRQQLSRAKADLDDLTGKVYAIDTEFQKELDNLNREHERQQRERTEKQSQAEREYLKEQHAHQLRVNDIEREGGNEVSALKLARSKEREALAEEESRYRVLKDNQSLTEEEKEELSRAEQESEEVAAQVESHQQRLTDAKDSRDQVARETEALAADVAEADKQVQSLDDDFLELQQIIAPESGTWLSQLRQEDPDWSHRLGKIIPADLVLRKDLAPTMAPGADPEAVMGWKLALEALPTPEFAMNEDQLQERSRALDLEREEARARRKEIEQVAKRRHDALKECREAVAVLETELSMFQRNRESANTKLINTRQRHDKAVSERAAEYKSLWAEKRQALSSFDQRTGQDVSDLESVVRQRVLDAKGHWADREAELKQVEKAIKDAIDTAESDHKARIETKRKAYEQKLSEEGVDPQVVREARERKEALDNRVSKLVAAEDEVRVYRKWREQEWSTVEQLTQATASAKSKREQLTRARKEASDAYKKESAELSRAISEQASAIKRLSDQLETAETVLKLFPAEPIATGFPGNIGDLTNELQGAYQRIQQLRKEVLSNYDIAAHILNEYDGTHIQKAWEKLTAYRKDQLADQSEVYDESFKLSQVPDLRKLLDDDIPQLTEAVIDQFVSESGSLVKYFDSLEVMAKEVQSVSSTLRRKINTDQQIESLSDIQVVLEPRIYEDETWQPLKEFVQHWQVWRQNNRRALPDDAILRRFKLVTDTLSDARVRESIESMIDLRIEMKENGRQVVIRTDADFLDASSTGLDLPPIV
ncbi:ATP-binding protein [Tamilnaduibacter salinus]|uniref:ATP-binding protein n=1 Tax=Tamilnaduibacter salinus TaxID=1484056 RepID=A0A2A2I1E9_9GAMM|nr:ATP-binding protein [Tamilnaduibacter salinus]PAV25477.1 ATP-binding protein [Tamilnaduibacter salinus]